MNVCSDGRRVPVSRTATSHVRTDLFGKDVAPLRRGPNPAGSPVKNVHARQAGAYDPAFLQSAYNAPSLTNGTGPDGGDRRRVRRAERRERPGDVPLGVRPARVHDRERLLQEGRPERRHALPGGQRGLGAGDLARRRHGERDVPALPHPAGRGEHDPFSDLGAAVNKAVALGANVVSNSYGAGRMVGRDAAPTRRTSTTRVSRSSRAPATAATA